MSNVIQEIDWATVVLDEQVLATEVWQPMFFWYWQLINTWITFFPVVFLVSMFWFIYWYIRNLWKKKTLSSQKSLENK